jgi:hypothetical protein
VSGVGGVGARTHLNILFWHVVSVVVVVVLVVSVVVVGCQEN